MKEGLINQELLTRWTELYGDITYLKARFLSTFGGKRAIEDPDFKGLLNTIRIIKATMAGDAGDFKELKRLVKRQLYFSTVELSLFLFAIRHPEAFLNYISRYLYPQYEKIVGGVVGNEKNRLFLAHNFVGARRVLLLLCAGFLKNGRKLLIYVDKPLFVLLHKMFESLLRSVDKKAKVEVYEDREFIVKGEYLLKYFGGKSVNSEICFLNCRKKENFSKAFRLMKGKGYSMALIPEVPIETKKRIVVSLLSKKLAITSGIEMISRFSDTVVSMVPDCTYGVLDFTLSIEEIERKGRSMKEIFQTIASKYERLAFISPELFVPFNYFNMWPDLFDEKSEETILDVLRDRGRCYVLLSNGDIYMGSYRELKQWI